jgi:hypothetical protein
MIEYPEVHTEKRIVTKERFSREEYEHQGVNGSTTTSTERYFVSPPKQQLTVCLIHNIARQAALLTFDPDIHRCISTRTHGSIGRLAFERFHGIQHYFYSRLGRKHAVYKLSIHRREAAEATEAS